jgi:hypothetical protein
VGYYKEGICVPPPARNSAKKLSLPRTLALEELIMPPTSDKNAGTEASWLRPSLLAAMHDEIHTNNGWRKRPRHRHRDGKRSRQRGRRVTSSEDHLFPNEASASDVDWKKLGYWAVDSYNSNTWNKAADALSTSAADYVALQEVREPDPGRCRRLERSARDKGWTASINPARRTEAGGASAGVAILGKKGHGITAEGCAAVSEDYADRINIKWCSGIRKGGFHLVSVYLWTAEGLTERNAALLHRLKLALRSIKGPWIVAGD